MKTTREGACGQPLWYNPHFKPPPATIKYQAAWEHLQGRTLDNTILNSLPYTTTQLESYLTAENGVEWHRDQITITITFAYDTTEKYDTNNLFEACEKITQKFPTLLKYYSLNLTQHLNNYSTLPI
jgi:hypothetical protein